MEGIGDHGVHAQSWWRWDLIQDELRGRAGGDPALGRQSSSSPPVPVGLRILARGSARLSAPVVSVAFRRLLGPNSPGGSSLNIHRNSGVSLVAATDLFSHYPHPLFTFTQADSWIGRMGIHN